MLSPEPEFLRIRRLVRRLMLAAKRSSGPLSGLFNSAFRGNGMLFEEVRAYVPGDDIRHMDWNVSARLQVPHVKVFREERQQSIRVMIDKSASMSLTKEGRGRNEVALELAWAFVALAEQAGDEVGVGLFNSTDHSDARPKRGTRHVQPILNRLLDPVIFAGRSELLPLLKKLSDERVAHQVLVFISDLFLEDNLLEMSAMIKSLARRNEVLFFHLRDAAESKVAVRWPVMAVREVEQGLSRVIMKSSKQLQGGSRDLKVVEALKLAGADVVTVSGPTEGLQRLGAYLQGRTKKYGRAR